MPLFAECELILVEGNSATKSAKVEVWRAEAGSEPMALEDPDIRAVISDDAPIVSQSVWPRNDLTQMAEKILSLSKE